MDGINKVKITASDIFSLQVFLENVQWRYSRVDVDWSAFETYFRIFHVSLFYSNSLEITIRCCCVGVLWSFDTFQVISGTVS